MFGHAVRMCTGRATTIDAKTPVFRFFIRITFAGRARRS